MLNFREKTIVGIALIEVVMLVVLVASALKFLDESNQRQLTQRAHATATMFSHAVTDAVLSTDLATLDDLVKEIMRLDDVVYAKVVGANRVLATISHCWQNTAPRMGLKQAMSVFLTAG